MFKLGLWLSIFGVGSFLLNMAGREFTILMWIDMWGAAIGNLIRGSVLVAGLALMGLHWFILSRAVSDSE